MDNRIRKIDTELDIKSHKVIELNEEKEIIEGNLRRKAGGLAKEKKESRKNS